MEEQAPFWAPKGGARRSCPHLAKPHLAKTAFGQKIRIWPICFLDRILPNRIWQELVFQSVDSIWPNSSFGQIFCCCCHCFCCCCCSWLLSLVPGCCLLLFVGACWCLLVPVGACWCLCGGCVQDFWASPPDPPPLDRPSPGPPKISLFFFSLSRRKFHSFFSLWGVFSLKFGGVVEDRGAQMCTFGAFGLSCKVAGSCPGPLVGA